MTEKTEEEILRLFATLAIPRQGALLDRLRVASDEQRELAATMISSLQSMGLAVPDLEHMKGISSDGRRAPAPKYRSRRDSTLTWSGRGHMARWLVEEIEATGLTLEDFKAV